jgi:hypothetical protein
MVVKFNISYHSPAVRNRIIWGGWFHLISLGLVALIWQPQLKQMLPSLLGQENQQVNTLFLQYLLRKIGQ